MGGNMIEHETEMTGYVALREDSPLEPDGRGRGFDVGRFVVGTWSDDATSWVPDVVLCFLGEGSTEEVTLRMTPDQARLLARAILENGIVSPQRN
jgi:hypothetical protein